MGHHDDRAAVDRSECSLLAAGRDALRPRRSRTAACGSDRATPRANARGERTLLRARPRRRARCAPPCLGRDEAGDDAGEPRSLVSRRTSPTRFGAVGPSSMPRRARSARPDARAQRPRPSATSAACERDEHERHRLRRAASVPRSTTTPGTSTVSGPTTPTRRPGAPAPRRRRRAVVVVTASRGARCRSRPQEGRHE